MENKKFEISEKKTKKAPWYLIGLTVAGITGVVTSMQLAKNWNKDYLEEKAKIDSVYVSKKDSLNQEYQAKKDSLENAYLMKLNSLEDLMKE